MRNTNIADVIFPVELEPVYYNAGDDKKPHYKRLPEQKVVINKKTGTPISVVSNGYELITNQQAMDYGKKCIHQLLESVNPKNIEIFNINTPKTKSYCYIDLIHKGYEVNIWQNEVYLPFLRISNSYNKSRALRFLIGFCRRVCDNGMIFETDGIEFKFSHTKVDFQKDIDFRIGAGKMKQLENDFKEYMKGISDISIKPEHAIPVFCKALNITFAIDADTQEKRDEANEDLDMFTEFIDPKIAKYTNELGDNAYALFNAITDYASNPDKDDNKRKILIPTLQRRAGEWMKELISSTKKKDFTWENYLGVFLQYSRN